VAPVNKLSPPPVRTRFHEVDAYKRGNENGTPQANGSDSGISWPWIKWFQELQNRLAVVTVPPLPPGTVTNKSGNLTLNAVVVGNGAADEKVLASLGTAGQVLTSAGPGFPPLFANNPAVSGFSDSEIPVGLIDGVNALYALAHNPSPRLSVLLFLNGLVQIQNVHYTVTPTLTAASILYNTAPSIGDTHVAWYRF
jgi:hypothetical protein